MAREPLWRCAIGEDVYIGTADEIVAFMAKAVGAPPGDGERYMRGIATRVRERLDLGPVDTEDADSFLESLAALGLVRLAPMSAPSEERVDVGAFVGDRPFAFDGGLGLDELGDLDDLLAEGDADEAADEDEDDR